VLIGEQETMPTSRLIGKIPFTGHTSAYSAKTEFTYADPDVGGIRNASECRRIAKAQSMYTSVHFQRLPVGKITYKTSIYAAHDTGCSDTAVGTLDSYYFINDAAKEMQVDFRP